MSKSSGSELVYDFIEGGSARTDIGFVLKDGVAQAKTMPWKDFIGRYYAFRDNKLAELTQPSAEFQNDMKVVNGSNSQLAHDYDVLGQQEASGQKDAMAGVDRVTLGKVKGNILGYEVSAKREFIDFLDQAAGKTAAEAESLLLGTNPQLAKDRQVIKTLLTNFHPPLEVVFPADPPCQAGGPDRKAAILSVLRKHIPVSVSMDVGKLPNWDYGVHPRGSWHAFTITGFKADAGGKVVLKSRNSWGGDNPDVPEADFCRIASILKVLTDQE